MSGKHDVPPMERQITRLGIETSIALAWNDAGAKLGLLPITWRLGNPDEYVHFAADADAYEKELRRDIIEAWISGLGLADDMDLLIEPLQQEGEQMIWTASVDGVTFQLRYPAKVGS